MAKNVFTFNRIHLIFFFLILPTILRSFISVENGSTAKVLLYSIYWISLFLLPYSNFKKLKYEFPKSFISLLVAIIIIGIVYIIKDINKGEIMTLLGNPTIGLPFLLPFFVLVSYKFISWKEITKLCAILILITPIFLFAGLPVEGLLNITTPLSFIVLPYLKKKWIPFINLIVVLAWLYIYDGQRYMLLLQLFSIVNWGIVYVIRKRNILKTAILSIILCPVILLCISIINEESFFSSLSDYTSNQDMSADTRSFLYIELFNDLSQSNAWITGKGPLGRYYSEYFDLLTVEGGDSARRINIEVGILQYIFKGGIIYLSLYLIILFSAIFYSFKNGKDVLHLSFSFLLATHFFMLFIYDLPSYSFINAFYWIVIGLCFSHSFLLLKIKQIK